MTLYQLSIVTICLICLVFKLYPLKDQHRAFDLENKGQGQIEGDQYEAHV